MKQAYAPIPFARLREWAAQPQLAEVASPLSQTPFLLCDLAGTEGLAANEVAAVVQWLHRQIVPTIAIGIAIGDGNREVAAAFDVATTTAGDLQALMPNLLRSPIAASVFVQLLRATAGMDVIDALAMESLAYATLQAGPEHRAWLQSHRSGPRSTAKRDDDAGPALIIARNDDRLDIELNRPSHRNAISMAMRDALVEAFRLIEADDSIRMARISGRGRCFSVGGDLQEFGTVADPATGHVIRGLSLPARHLLRCAERVGFHLHGACIGAGIELPAFSPSLTAASDAFFQLPELRFGLIPGAGGCVSLPRRIGRQRTALLVLSGRRLGAGEALEWGLVDSIA